MKTTLLKFCAALIFVGSVAASCNSNKQEEKDLDTVYGNTDDHGHPVENKDSITMYEEHGDMPKDTTAAPVN